MDCVNKEKNLNNCNCTFSCGNKGMCCECVRYHNSKGQFPACFFSDAMQKTADRSFEALVKDRMAK